MTDPDHSEITRLLALADNLVRLGIVIPRIDPDSDEPIEALAERRRTMERSLAQRLREIPTCELVISPDGTDVELALAGLRVRSRSCLAGAFTAWIAHAKQRSREAAQPEMPQAD